MGICCGSAMSSRAREAGERRCLCAVSSMPLLASPYRSDALEKAMHVARYRHHDLRSTPSTPRSSQHAVDTGIFAARRRHRDLLSTPSTPRSSQHAVETAIFVARRRHHDLRRTASTPRCSQDGLVMVSLGGGGVEAPRRPPQARSEFQTQAASGTRRREQCLRGRSLCLSGGLRRAAGRRYWPPLGPRGADQVQFLTTASADARSAQPPQSAAHCRPRLHRSPDAPNARLSCKRAPDRARFQVVGSRHGADSRPPGDGLVPGSWPDGAAFELSAHGVQSARSAARCRIGALHSAVPNAAFRSTVSY